ncbi:nucleotide-binding domain containing protein [Halomonas sp.]|uniref:nucleotide-binding domain containing protein n=1 Tax=Halomonas sp. TaxID=1486246 RepID=UPI0038603224
MLFLTGGDIAMATLRRLGVTSISVEAEWAPGVALGCLDGEPTRRVMTKAGGFGAPDLLQRLHRAFH